MEAAKIYCRRDVEICMAAMKYIDFVDREGLGTLAKTTQDILMLIDTDLCPQKYIFMTTPGREIERCCYYGGRVECWRIGNSQDFYGYDINSMYPYVMQNLPTRHDF